MKYPFKNETLWKSVIITIIFLSIYIALDRMGWDSTKNIAIAVIVIYYLFLLKK